MVETRRFTRGGMTQITTDRYGRWYEFGGERFFSVTTIIGGGIPKPVLLNWAKKFVAVYALDNFDRLTAKVEALGQIDDRMERDGEYESIRKWLSDSPFRSRDAKAKLGTDVHDYVEAYATGQPLPDVPDDIAPYIAQFKVFLDTYQPTIVAAEAPVFSREQRYAGTLDSIMEFDPAIFDDKTLRIILGSISDEVSYADTTVRIAEIRERGGLRVIVDYKTGKGVYPEVALQLAAYRYADTFLGMPDGSEGDMPELDGAVVLHLRDTFYDLYPVMTDESVFKTFLYAREVFRWGRDLGQMALGAPTTAPVVEEGTDGDT